MSASLIMATDTILQIRLNGEHRSVPAGLSIAEMLGKIGFDARKVAVERNLEIVPRSELGEVQVAEGDAFEIVHFVGGG
jgi:thiamine biosynthesis protein ThiS